MLALLIFSLLISQSFCCFSSKTSTSDFFSTPSDPIPIKSTVTLTSGHTNSITSLILLTSGNFASGSADASIKIWSSTTDAILRTISAHTGGVRGLAALSNDNFASVGADGNLKIWSANSNTATQTIAVSGNALTAVAKLSNGNVAVALSSDFSIKVYDPNTGAAVTPTFTTSHTGTINFLISLSNGNLASASNDDTIKIWSGANGGVAIRTLTGHTGNVHYLKEIGTDLASASADFRIKIWDVTTGSTKTTIGSFFTPYSIEYLSNKYLTSGTTFGYLDFYDTTGKLYKSDSPASNSIYSQLKLTSGNLVIGDSYGTLKILKF